jgi:hypothetical protein
LSLQCSFPPLPAERLHCHRFFAAGD